MRRFMPLILFALLGAAFAFGLTRDPRKLESVLIDRAFPEFAAQTLDGAPVDHTALSGQAQLVNVFGSWCVACDVEHPLLMELGRSGVPIIGINWRDTDDKAKAWLARKGDPYNLIITDPDSQLAISLGVTGAPETFIVDGQARIRYKHTGPITQDDWKDVLRPLLAQLEAGL